MSRKTLLTITLTALLGGFLAGPAVASERSMTFSDLNTQRSSGQIQGKVASCLPKYDPQGTIVHIPGISVSTQLSADGAFTLQFVPEGKHNLAFEQNGQLYKFMQGVEVKSSHRTELGESEDGSDILAGFNDMNAARLSGTATQSAAKEVCDRKDNNGDGEIDEGCSYRKCPKGGKFCMSNWNNINPWLRGLLP